MLTFWMIYYLFDNNKTFVLLIAGIFIWYPHNRLY